MFFLFLSTGPIESWFIVDIMELRGFDREISALFASLIGFANFLGRGLGAVLRLGCRYDYILKLLFMMNWLSLSCSYRLSYLAS